MIRFYLLFLIFSCIHSPALYAKNKIKVAASSPKTGEEIKIAYLSQTMPPPMETSSLDAHILDIGKAGAQLGIEDNNTTGQFTKQLFKLESFILQPEDDPVAMYNDKIAKNFSLVLLNLPTEKLLALVNLPNQQNQIFLNIGNSADELRGSACKSNMFHLMPSRAMRTDALAQYMLKKKWSKWFLVTGSNPEDMLYANALKRAAKRFGLKISEEKSWQHTFENRRSEQSDIPVFTQVDDYQVLAVADEQALFGEYLAYRTWLPRPVIGTQGLIATAWHKTHEQWGASQIQNRFASQNKRNMEEIDYAAYLAIRAIGEAATRSKSGKTDNIKTYLLSDGFALQGYKGNPLSFRTWDHQLRQPILLAADRALVAVAPIEGFLHPKTELDTLGYDQAESECHL